MNWLTIALGTLIITLTSSRVEAKGIYVECNYHFWPSDKVVTKGSCVNKVNRKKDHTCILDSCHTKFSRRHWANFGFFNYHNKEGVNRRHVTVTQYYRRKGFVAARDQDKSWWDCLFTPEFPLNRDYVVCGDCTQA
ncbi:hypothetical protein Pst134EA_009748 [Puccinia striiformis f. sp. tritici]|uniref:hypothetical protein n=1 Tax=Puccinia striiformis f. sp. tritici TaxID=168172 RepID=UPI0020075174|nr:hypothetical protein Pst134EA_009748 [Puccinia striiformis f. sp. tritici]KAH9469221.1 hypothetical protein Pst134EA_009748 [Puccinia striiformis f. sp. tritici]